MIIAGIASIPNREKDLRHILDAIAPQVDMVIVSLNGYLERPPYAKDYDNVMMNITDNSKGDAMKFDGSWADGYHLCLDDDLIPPKGYVDDILEGVDKYNGLVSFHGRTYLKPIVDFRRWAGNYRCLNTVSDDVKVNFIGSGCCAFKTSRLKLSLEDFKKPNMADCYLSRLASEQGVSMVVLAHPQGYFEYTNPKTTIWNTTHDYTEQVKILQSYIK